MESNEYAEYDQVHQWNEVQLLARSALKEINTRMEVLNDEYQQVCDYNPIEHIKSRIKTSESIVKKLKKKGYEATIPNMLKYVEDIAGIRIICSFEKDIYYIAETLVKQDGINMLSVKDYINEPKESGYKSFHMIIEIPVFLSTKTVKTKVEVQIRTVAMDFWASLEHKIHYKFEGDIPDSISQELIDCAKIVSELDEKMERLNDEVQSLAGKNS